MKRLLYFYLGIACLYLLTSSGRIAGRDALAMFKVAANIVEHASVSAEPCQAGPAMPQCVKGIDGRNYSSYGVFPSVAVAPVFFLAGPVSSIARMEKTIIAGFFVSMLCALIAAIVPAAMAHWVTLMGYSWRAAVFTGIVCSFGSPFWHYGVKEFYSEPYMALGLVISALLLLHGDSSNAFAVAGLFLGVACASRIVAVLEVPLFVAVFAYRVWRVPGRITNLVFFLAPLGAVLAGMGILNRLHYGSFFRTAYQANFTLSGMFSTPMYEGIFGYLFGGDTSLILFCPIILLSAWGFSKLFRTNGLDATLCLGTFVFHTMLLAKYEEWNSEWSYGPRFLIPVLPFALLPLCTLFESRLASARRGQIAAYTLLAISIAINIPSAMYPLNRYHLTNKWASARSGSPVYLGCLKTMITDLPEVLSETVHFNPNKRVANPLLNDTAEENSLDATQYSELKVFFDSLPNPINIKTVDLWWVKIGLLFKRYFLLAAGSACFLFVVGWASIQFSLTMSD